MKPATPKWICGAVVMFCTMEITFAALKPATPGGPATEQAGSEERIPDLRPPGDVLPELTVQPSHFWQWLAGGTLFVCGAVVFLRTLGPKLPPPVAPYVSAYRKLDQARSTSDPRVVWEAFRTYALAAVHLNRPGVTASELIEELSRHMTLTPKLQSDMTALFAECDVVKFSPEKNPVPDLVDRAIALLNALEANQGGRVAT